MKLEQLNYFLEAARQEHVGKAARVLSISPSAISHSISALENELGAPLFDRKGKNILLTNHGRLLMERASELLSRAQEIREEMTAENIELQGHYKLAATHVLATHFLAPSWIHLQNQNKNLTGEVYTLRSAQVYGGVVQGDYQVGLCFSPLAHPDLNIKSVYTGQLQVGLRRDHPIFDLPLNERPKALNKYKATLPKAFQGIDVCESHPVFQKFGIKPDLDLAWDSYEVGIEKVAQSTAWSFFPDLFFDWNQNRIKPLGKIPGWSAPYNISIIWPKHQYLSRALVNLIDEVESRLS